MKQTKMLRRFQLKSGNVIRAHYSVNKPEVIWGIEDEDALYIKYAVNHSSVQSFEEMIAGIREL